jgi:hypothetical protein
VFLPVSTIYSPEQYYASKDGGNTLFGCGTDLITLTLSTIARIVLLYNPPNSTSELYLSRTQLTQNVDGDWTRYRLLPSNATATFTIPGSAAPLTSINRGSAALNSQGKIYALTTSGISIPSALLVPEVTIQAMGRVPQYVLENGSIVLGRGYGLVWAFTPIAGVTLKSSSVGVENVWWEKPI